MKSFQLGRHLKFVLSLIAVLSFIMGVPLGALADSNRFSTSTGYAAQDYDFAAGYDVYYSGGLDTVYANVSTADAPTRAFIHEQTDLSNNLDVQLYFYDGTRSVTLFSTTVAWPQAVKKIGDRIWYTYTGSSGAGYYSVPWDETLAIYPVAAPTSEVISEYNWEVEEDHDGRIFVCGATSMAGGQAIGFVDVDNANNVVSVINVGGNSSGFAIDNSGNIWSGEYILGYTGGMHIEPCRLGMWTRDDIDTAIATGTPLTWDDAEVTINLGTTGISGDTTNWGPNDIEVDPQGNVYISLNTYNAWNFQSEWGAVKVYSPDGAGGYTESVLGTTVQRTDTDEWDWARSLSFDGNGTLDDGGYSDPTQGGPTANILYLDMDLGATGNDVVDQLVAITVDADYDADGIPDSVDNAPETANPGQEDTDGDGYGNIADADLDNSDTVDFSDFATFQSAWLQSGTAADMDSSGTVDFSDFTLFQGRWLTSAPYY